MDSRQAKEILLLYREGIDRPDDPEFAEALALASRDPVLATWLEQQRAVRSALRASFKQIAVPEGLKEQIVSERRARMTLAFKRKALLASAAAAVLLIATAVVILNRPPGEDKHFSGFQSRMAGIVLRSYPQQMDLATNDLGQIHQYLVKQGQPDYILPAALAKTAGTGCKLLTWQGKPVSMVCLNSGKNGKPRQPDLFLFIINQTAVPDPSSVSPRELVQVSKLSLLSWKQNGNLYLLGALGPQAKPLQDSVAADVQRL